MSAATVSASDHSTRSGPSHGLDVRSLCEAFQRTAARYPAEVALRTADGAEEWTWAQFRDQAEHVARGLIGLGVRPGATVGLLLRNRPEFHILDVAVMHARATPFSIYQTSSPTQIGEICDNARPAVIITEPAFLDRVILACRDLDAMPLLVLLDGSEEGTLTLDEVVAAGEPDSVLDWSAVDGSDVATLIYTSGTTGPPKGVMITHANLLAAWASSTAAVPVIANRGRYMSYLPTAHLADRMFSHYPALCNGSSITCVEDPAAAVAALASVRPTVWMSVPRIWEKLKDAIESGSFGPSGADVSASLGLDAADLVVSGSAPIRADVLEFFASRGIQILEGYGLTESTAIATLNRPGGAVVGSVGTVMPGVELVLAGDGEILLRGPNVMAGYRDAPDASAEAVDRAGWLHTGDLGEFSDGVLRITGRKKEIIINAAGKNMSPHNIEAALKAASPLLAHAVVIGDRRPYNTALLVLDPEQLAARASSPHDSTVHEEVDAAVRRANAQLSRVEQIKRFRILEVAWPPDGEFVTPTLKVRRGPVAERYAAEIEEMYA